MRLGSRSMPFFAFFCLALSLARGQSPSSQQSASFELKPGVVIEKVTKNSEAEKVGLVEGDILLGWVRGETHGNIQSPLDLFDLEIEQVTRGVITLQGLRGGEARTWTWTESKNWTAREGTWGVTGRPNLDGRLLAEYRAGQAAAESGKHEQAAALWKSVLDTPNRHLPPWLNAWFLLQSAQSLMEAKQWNEAESACGQAAQLLAPEKSIAAAQVSLFCANAFSRKHEKDRAERLYQAGLGEARESAAKSLTSAAILINLGRAASGFDKMVQFMEEALAMQESLVPDSLTVSASLNRLGVFLQESGDLDRSQGYLERSLAIREKLAPESSALAQTLEALADTLMQRGDADRPEPYLLRALTFWGKAERDSLFVAGCLVDLANVADLRDDLAKEEEYLRRALVIQLKLSPRGSGAAASLNNLGLVLQARGQLDAAEETFQHSLSIKQELDPNSTNVAMTLNNLGILSVDRGELEKGEQYLRRAAAIHEQKAPRSLPLGTTYSELGDVALQRNQLSEAETYFRKALAIDEADAPMGALTADTLRRLGTLALKQGDLEQAEKNYSKALALRKRLSPDSMSSGVILMELAEVARLKQRPDEAAELYQQGLDAVEAQTARVGGDEAIRAGFRSVFENYYKNYVNLLIARKRADLAFQVLERSRARTLLEMLTAGHVDIHQGVDPALLNQERSLRANITAKADRRIRLLGGEHSDEQIAALDQEINSLLKLSQEVAGRILANSPNYADLTQPQPVTVAELQQLLGPDTALLEYSLGDDRSYIFAVTANSVVAHELPQRTQIEQLARDVYQSLTARKRVIESETLQQAQTRWRQADRDYLKLAGRLSQMVLGPVTAEMKGKRLVIVSDGALQYIPFAALPVEEDHGLAPLPLIMTHEVVNLPSASALAVLRKQEKERKPVAKTVAVLADPVFSLRDGRLVAAAARPTGDRRPTDVKGGVLAATNSSPTNSGANELLTRSVHDVGLLDLARLPYTRREAEAIMSLTPPGEGLKALDFEATRAIATSPELSRYRIVHFATHGLLDSQHPELSGLVLSLVDQQGKPQSGFLALEDIYNLDLPVELVVLSACETGLGREINGEGLIGLTRGFMYAGANRVVASLWSVNDVATAELMANFYKGMLRDRILPASALRQAQIHMWKSGRWSSPYYWAAFQIQGDWR